MNPTLAAAIARAAKEQAEAPLVQMVPGMTLHADGDYFAYACAGDDECPPYKARDHVINRLFTAQQQAGAQHVLVHLSARNTNKGQRGLVSTVKPYQGQRVGSRKPRNWQYLRDFLEGLPNILSSSHREADDSIAERLYAANGRDATYTADKDMRMLPGLHLDWATYRKTFVPPGSFDVIGVDGLQFGHKWFWLQMLQGDTADNIPGLEKCVSPCGSRTDCGPVTAGLLLGYATNSEEALAAVAEQYRLCYGDSTWADRFVEQAMLLWLRKHPDAPLHDFLMDNDLFPKNPTPAKKEIIAAINRTVRRVKERSAAIEAITSQADTRVFADDPEW